MELLLELIERDSQLRPLFPGVVTWGDRARLFLHGIASFFVLRLLPAVHPFEEEALPHTNTFHFL